MSKVRMQRQPSPEEARNTMKPRSVGHRLYLNACTESYFLDVQGC
jgi:hypothetical protein